MIDSVIIARALQQVAKLTLPNFGTFLKKENGEIVFTSFMKNDDMVFTSIIMNSYNVSQSDASQMVVEFISNILANISENGSFFIPEIGFLVKDSLSGAIKLKKEDPRPEVVPPIAQPIQPQPQPIIQQQRQPISPRPIIGVPQPEIPQQPRQFQQPPLGPRPQGIPQRPQGMPQRPLQRPQPVGQPRPAQRPPYPPRPNGGQPNRMQRPGGQRPPVKKRSKTTDWLLLIAIIVILIIICLIIYSLFFAETISDLM